MQKTVALQEPRLEDTFNNTYCNNKDWKKDGNKLDKNEWIKLDNGSIIQKHINHRTVDVSENKTHKFSMLSRHDI